MKKIIFILVVAMSTVTLFAAPLIIYVTPTGSSEGDGLSWANAVSIDRARNLANWYNTKATPVENQIWMKAGSYDIEKGIQLTYQLTIYGGFTGKESLLSERNWVTNQTIINRTGDNPGQVIWSNVEKDVLLDGLILQGGRPTSSNGCGTITNGTTMRNCIIRDNKAGTNTCGLSIEQVKGATKIVVIDNCLIINNEATDFLEVIKIGVPNTEIRNTTIANNLSTTANNFAVITGKVPYKVYNSIIYNNLNVSTVAKNFGENNSKELTNNAWDLAPTDGTLTNNIMLSSSPFVAATEYAGAATGGKKRFSAIKSANFRLANGSSCINAGNNTYATATIDLSGATRIQHSIVDLGCFESSFSAGFNNKIK